MKRCVRELFKIANEIENQSNFFKLSCPYCGWEKKIGWTMSEEYTGREIVECPECGAKMEEVKINEEDVDLI